MKNRNREVKQPLKSHSLQVSGNAKIQTLEFGSVLLVFFYGASKYICNVSHDIYNESYETTFVSMPASCINDLNLFLHCQRLPDRLLILSSRTGTILVQGPGQGPQGLFITSGWQCCHMEPSGYSVGLASSLKVEGPPHPI